MAQVGVEPDNPSAQTILTQIQTAELYRGPIPAPGSLAEYDEVIPGLAREIIDAWHEQRRHRLKLETTATKSSGDRMDRSQRNSLIIGIVGLVVAGAAGIWGGWGAAAIIALVAVGGPNVATILARFIRPGE